MKNIGIGLLIVLLLGMALASVSHATQDLTAPASKPQLPAGTAEQVAATPADSRRPTVAIGGDGVVHVAWEENGAIYYSQKSGLSWTTPITVSTGDSPALAMGSGNIPHLTWVDVISPTSRIYYSRRESGTWLPRLRISSQSFNASSPDIAVAPSGTLYLVWMQRVGGVDTIYYATSSDGGQTWPFRSPLRSDAQGGAPVIAIEASGLAHVAWQNRGAPGSPYNIFHSQAVTSTWSLPGNISSSGNNSNFPTLALSGGRAHLAWRESVAGAGEIYYSKGSGLSWSPPITVSNTITNSTLPSLAADAQGTLFLAWDEGDTLLYSYNLGRRDAWPSPIPLASNPEIGDVALVKASDGTVHAAWAEQVAGGNWDIFYSSQPLCFLTMDFDGDQDVDINDIMAVAVHWHTSAGMSNYDSTFDLDTDTDTDIADLMRVVANWGMICR